jgi:ribonucleoside-triphosphate reductase
MDNKYKITKRDGRKVIYNIEKIYNAILNATKASDYGVVDTDDIAGRIAEVIDRRLREMWLDGEEVHVETVQDLVEENLMDAGYYDIVKRYMIYRHKHQKIRNMNKKFTDAMNMIDDYLNLDDWKVNENSNMGYSLQGLNNHISAEITEEYWLQEIYPQEVTKLHKSGDLHIHDLGQLSVYCVGWDLKDVLLEGFSGVTHKVESNPPRHFDTALMQAVNFLFTLQGESAGAQAFSSFDTYLAPFIHYDNLDYKEVKQAMQQFIYNLNVPTRVGFQTPFTNITLDLNPPKNMKDTPVIIGGEHKEESYGDFQEEMDMFNSAFAEVMMEGDKKGRVFSFPIPTYNVTEDFPWDKEELKPVWEMTAKYGIPYFSNMVNSDLNPEDIRSMCCRLQINNKQLRKRGGGLFGANPLTGSVGVVTINLPRIGYQSENKREFLNRIEKLMDVAKTALESKRKVLEKLTDRGLYPYNQFYLRKVKQRFDEYWKNHFNTIGILGMNEALDNLLGENMGTEQGNQFAVEVMEFMRDKLVEYQEETGDIFNLEATPGESTTYRFAKLDREHFGDDIVCANQNKVVENTAEPYYTNSTHLPVGYTDDVFEALELMDETQKLYTGGTVVHSFLGEQMPNIESTKKLIKRTFENFQLPYFSITPTFSICPKHGYLPGKHEYCPKCDDKLRAEGIDPEELD